MINEFRQLENTNNFKLDLWGMYLNTSEKNNWRNTVCAIYGLTLTSEVQELEDYVGSYSIKTEAPWATDTKCLRLELSGLKNMNSTNKPEEVIKYNNFLNEFDKSKERLIISGDKYSFFIKNNEFVYVKEREINKVTKKEEQFFLKTQPANFSQNTENTVNTPLSIEELGKPQTKSSNLNSLIKENIIFFNERFEPNKELTVDEFILFFKQICNTVK